MIELLQNEFIVTVVLLMVGFVSLLVLLLDFFSEAEKDKSEILSKSVYENIKTKRKNKFSAFFDGWVEKVVSLLPNDSKSLLFKELKKWGIYGGALIAVGLIFNFLPLLLMGILFVISPILKRYSNKNQYKQVFKDDFFDSVFYLILFVSGGMSVQHAFAQTTSLLPPMSQLRSAFERILREHQLTQENFVKLFRLLQEDHPDIDEINYFITSLEVAYNKGISINESLKSQLGYIRRNRNFYFKSLAGGMGNKLTPLMIAFSMVPLLLIMAAPPILEAMEMMSQV